MKKINNSMRFVKRLFLKTYQDIVLLLPINPIKIRKMQKMRPLKLNVGCGKVKIPGWINIDIEPGADLIVDVRKGLPFADSSVDFIYSEHVIEHFTYNESKILIMECKRCLKDEGVLRVATPDLDYIISRYNSDWKNQDWLLWPEYNFIRTKGQMINISFRWWGHKFLYNEEDLSDLLMQTGFKNATRCEFKKSSHSELSLLETREDSKLIYEVSK